MRRQYAPLVPRLDERRHAADEALRGAWFAFGISVVPAAGGLAILFGSYLDGGDEWGMAGLGWLLVGGLWTFVMTIANGVSIYVNYADRLRHPAAVVFAFALLICAVDVVTAMVCIQVGPGFLSKPVHVVVHNQTDVPIDRIVVHFGGGDVTVNGLPPHGAGEVRRVRPGHSGPLLITVTAGGESLKKTDIPSLGDRAYRDGRFDVYVEEAELPRSVRPPWRPTR